MKARLAYILGILALAFGVVAPTAYAQSTQPAGNAESSITGTVVSSTSTALVIRDESGVEQRFDVDTSSTVPPGLMSGSRVTIRFHSMDAGRRHVASVTTSDAGTSVAAPTATAPTEPTTFAPTQPPTPATDVTTPTADRPMDTRTPSARVRSSAATDLEPMPAAPGDRLPDTASEMPLLALAGLMTLAAGLVLRELRRRDA